MGYVIWNFYIILIATNLLGLSWAPLNEQMTKFLLTIIKMNYRYNKSFMHTLVWVFLNFMTFFIKNDFQMCSLVCESTWRTLEEDFGCEWIINMICSIELKWFSSINEHSIHFVYTYSYSYSYILIYNMHDMGKI